MVELWNWKQINKKVLAGVLSIDAASVAPSSCLAVTKMPLWRASIFICVCGIMLPPAHAQEKEGPKSAPANEDLSRPTSKVDIKPVARDEEIRQRLQNILVATEWFKAPQVEVTEGVVFLRGGVESEALKKWAGDLARNTQDVAAVVNRMEIVEPSIWDFGPASGGLVLLWRDFIRSLPLLGFGLVIIVVSLFAGLLTTRGARSVLLRRIRAKLLRNVIASAIGVLVFLFGIYIVLRISGLTQLALTVVGGTGLVGLAVGIAFRDITENFLASVFLSVQRPFEMGDLVEVSGVTGYVQQLNVRTTILMTLEGNLVQIPNATVYKSNLRNFTANANRREDFAVGIGYEDSIDEAQEIARAVLTGHPAVLTDPEPSVLAESLGKATVNLRIYFWINGHEYSWLKVRSSLIRLIKRAYQKHGISMPDEAREVIFPNGIPVKMINSNQPDKQESPSQKEPPTKPVSASDSSASTKAEAGLLSEASMIKEQARKAQPLQDGENLLPAAPGASSSPSPAK
jgi:small conductance mechanosensitive channel